MPTVAATDPYHLHRFEEAQAHDYPQALAELLDGKKRTHWIWYIFPQIDGLGSSPAARYYAISGLAEARAYLDHPTLGPRLRECCAAIMTIRNSTAREILGTPDDLKLRSCATLFAQLTTADSVFSRLLDRFFEGQPDQRTLALLARGDDE